MSKNELLLLQNPPKRRVLGDPPPRSPYLRWLGASPTVLIFDDQKMSKPSPTLNISWYYIIYAW